LCRSCQRLALRGASKGAHTIRTAAKPLPRLEPGPIAFIDLAAQQQRIRHKIDAAIARVLAHGAYVMGPEVKAFEDKLAAFADADHAISCANGTEALALPLMAWGVGPGDAVFCPSFTFAATGEVIPWFGASPVFVDIRPDTYCLDADKLEAAIVAIKAEGRLRPRAAIAVDLFGQPADYVAIAAVARRHDLKLIADSAQAFGCTLHGRHPIHWADAVTTSFFPAKPLGGYGDGGAVLTDDAWLAERIDSLRVHGKATASDIQGHAFDHDPKYLNLRVGMNSRLDTMQAAILLEKLAIFADELNERDRIAARYAEGLAGVVASTPQVIAGGISTWAQYTIEHPDRDGLAAHLKALGVPTAAYYPMPMHRQDCYAVYPQPGGLPVSEEKAETVLSLPMHAYLDEDTQDHIIEAVRSFRG
jgi:dTDP-4-amino-4,6-dideoxygalactose transaminase